MSNDKWERIKAVREARRLQEQEVEVEEISALTLIEAILEERPGNFKTVFEQLMQDRLESLVSEAKQYYANSLLDEQEADEEDLGDEWDDEDPEDLEDDELNDEEDLEDEDEIEEGHVKGHPKSCKCAKCMSTKEEEELDEVRFHNQDLKKSSSLRAKMAARKLRQRNEEDGHLRGKGTTIGAATSHKFPGGGHGGAPGSLGTKTDKHNRVEKTDKTNTKPEQSAFGKASGPDTAFHKTTLARLKSMSGKIGNAK